MSCHRIGWAAEGSASRLDVARTSVYWMWKPRSACQSKTTTRQPGTSNQANGFTHVSIVARDLARDGDGAVFVLLAELHDAADLEGAQESHELFSVSSAICGFQLYLGVTLENCDSGNHVCIFYVLCVSLMRRSLVGGAEARTVPCR